MDLRKLLPSGKTSKPVDLDQAIADANLERFRIAAEAERLVAEREKLLLTADDETLAKHDQAIAAAWRQHDRADAVIAELERQVAAVAERQAETVNRKFYDETIREKETVETWLREKFPHHAEEIAGGLARIKALALRTTEANRRLPPGASHILDAEWTVRRPPGSEPALPLEQTVNLPGLVGGDVNFWPRNTVR